MARFLALIRYCRKREGLAAVDSVCVQRSYARLVCSFVIHNILISNHFDGNLIWEKTPGFRRNKQRINTEAAELLDRAGHRQWNGEPYTLRAVFRLRARVGMQGHLARRQAQLRARGYVTAGELAKQLGRSAWSVKALGRQGRLLCAPIKTGGQSTAMYKLPPGVSANDYAPAPVMRPGAGSPNNGG